jgi:uncharacterized protein (TIRG00374 family)
MTNNPKSAVQRKYLQFLPGLFVSLAALVIILFVVDWQEVLSALRQADYRYLLLGVPVYLIAYGFRAWAWQTLLIEQVSFRRVFLTMQAGYLLNNILPFRLGELGRAFLLGRTGLGFWRVFSTILIERAFDMVLAAGLLLGTLPFVIRSPESRGISYLVGGAVLAGLVVLHMMARNQEWVVLQYGKLASRWSVFKRFGVKRVRGFINGLSALVQFKRFMRVLIWMLSSWGLAVLYQYILLLAFEPSAQVLWAAFGLATASMGVALPSSPSYLGVFEAAWIGALSLFQVSISTALAYALTIHVIHILVSSVFGIYALMHEGETLSQLYSEIRNQRFIEEQSLESE